MRSNLSGNSYYDECRKAIDMERKYYRSGDYISPPWNLGPPPSLTPVNPVKKEFKNKKLLLV